MTPSPTCLRLLTAACLTAALVAIPVPVASKGSGPTETAPPSTTHATSPTVQKTSKPQRLTKFRGLRRLPHRPTHRAAKVHDRWGQSLGQEFGVIA